MCPSPHSAGRCFITGGGCEITLFPTPEQRTFCLHGGEDNLGSTGTQPPGSPLPRVSTASGAKVAAAQLHGMGGGAGNLPAAAPTAGHLSRLKREEQNLTFSSLGLISSAKPPFGAVDGHGWPGQRPLPSWGASSGQA